MKYFKVLILVNDLSSFVSNRLPIAEKLISKQFKVYIAYGELGGADLKKLKDKGLKTFHVQMRRGGVNILEDIKSFYFIWKLIRNLCPDILHLVTIKPYLYGGVISRILNVPCVVSAVAGLGSVFIQQNLKSKFLRILLYPLYIFAFGHPNQYIILQNKDDKKFLLKWGVIKPNKICLIPGSGVKLENFVKLTEYKTLPRVCFVGRLIKEKGIYDFISAAKLLKKRDIKAKFLVAGNKDLKNPSGLNNENLKKIKTEGFVKLLGYQKNIPILYSKSHIICLPSYREGMPKALIDAAAASRAIVTTNVPGCRQSIIPNVSGLLVPIKSPRKLADAIQWLIENPVKRINMGKNGRKLAKKKFEINKIVKLHLDIYLKLLKKKFSLKKYNILM